MVLSDTERVMARRQIMALIQSDPVDIVLFRKPRLSDTAGGWTWGNPTPIAPQRIAIVPFKRRMSQFLVNTELGDLPELPYVLLGMPSFDVQREDTFTWQGDRFKVETVDIKQEVRVAAQADYYGGTTNG